MPTPRRAFALLLVAAPAAAQQPEPTARPCQSGGAFGAPAGYRSVEPLADGRVTFRLCAPDVPAGGDVRVTSADAPAIPQGAPNVPAGLAMTRDATGLWSATTAAPVGPGTYRYLFRVNGVRLPDPQASRFSEERFGVTSVFEVAGAAAAAEAWDAKVPHGAVQEVEYWSTALGARRRAHVYTPPGYERGSARYPVLYLVHGAGDSDDSWTSVGQAHRILDNLIAAGKARPMLVVMPAGHTPPRAGADLLRNADFGDDLHRDLIPWVEARYRTLNAPASRAMAGLSMGGAHTLQFGLVRPDRFAWLGVFSMGLLDSAQVARYEGEHAAALRRAGREARLVYYAMGRDDFLYRSVAPTRAVLERHGVRHVYRETAGGHTWLNWRDYLADFAPRIFR